MDAVVCRDSFHQKVGHIRARTSTHQDVVRRLIQLSGVSLTCAAVENMSREFSASFHGQDVIIHAVMETNDLYLLVISILQNANIQFN